MQANVDISDPNAPLSQAERIFRRFGGAQRLVELLKVVGDPRNKSSVYRWAYPKEVGGTGGFVPVQAWPSIIKAARLAGIFLTTEDTDPRFFNPNPRAHVAPKSNGKVAKTEIETTLLKRRIRLERQRQRRRRKTG